MDTTIKAPRVNARLIADVRDDSQGTRLTDDDLLAAAAEAGERAFLARRNPGAYARKYMGAPGR